MMIRRVERYGAYWRLILNHPYHDFISVGIFNTVEDAIDYGIKYSEQHEEEYNELVNREKMIHERNMARKRQP